ncbi:ABC transporter ATP-binding protein [Candidatus Sumerlaeota bacterium]|nr:ABC transporter ATP-binding protein [Candidatus Sumerlaeota bacterium]
MSATTEQLPAIELRDVCKTFHHSIRYSRSLKELFVQSVTFKLPPASDTTALHNLNLTVQSGEAIGVIGSNGSGKTTLLNLIAGVTPVTSGELITRGRITTLTDLKSGFHPDLSGMENIFLCCSLFGESRRKVFEILDDIQEMAGLQDFIYTPVKYYSSGMLVRLTFSIAFYVNPDILLLDEILVCGDQYFQQVARQCIRRYKKRGKTFFFVSHFLDQVESLCERVIWLERGRLKMDGPTAQVIAAYRGTQTGKLGEQRSVAYSEERAGIAEHIRLGTSEAQMVNVRIANASGDDCLYFQEGEPISVEVEFETKRRLDDIELTVVAGSDHDMSVAVYFSHEDDLIFRDFHGKGCFRVTLDSPLRAGNYFMSFALGPSGEERFFDFYDVVVRSYRFWVRGDDSRNPALLELPCAMEWKNGDS